MVSPVNGEQNRVAADIECDDAMEVDEDGAEEAEEPNVGKSKSKTAVVNNLEDVNKIRVARRMRMIKHIVMSLTTPSYVLGLGNQKVRAHNRSKLFSVLRKLVRQQNWKEASGVLSLVLRATSKDMCPRNNRLKYWTAMELVKRCKRDRVVEIDRFFNVWMKKFKNSTTSVLDESIALQLDFILFLLNVGEESSAIVAAKDLQQMRNYASNPLSNVILGLTYYQSWYSSLPSEERLTKADIFDTLVESDHSGPKFDSLMRYSIGCSIAANNEPEDQEHYDSETSVMINKEVLHEATGSPCEGRLAEAAADSEREIFSQPFQSQGFYLDSDNSSPENSEEAINYHINEHISIFATQGLDRWLLPLRLPTLKGPKDFSRFKSQAEHKDYVRAVEHLCRALHSKPPVPAALVPLVQLLLLGDQVGKALQELEKFLSNSGTALGFRLKASILEHFDHNNYADQIFSYECLMKKDPTCSHALGKLITLHHEGEYDSDSLIEMIALHLDATYPDYLPWKEFAICFFELTRFEEDRLSVCQDGNQHEQVQGVTTRIPKIFKDPKLAKSWIFRCKWWLNRHFGKKMVQEEIRVGHLELLAYKAACASHMYGRDFEYVQKAHSFLANENKELLQFLQMHLQHSVGFYLNILRKPG
uniref:Uncharacterized protein n=1 Tax=Kalanchoe fedtschenkoi TaxID=63787 RepID=A0A7N0ZR57_KALFE